jgi:hypothetical protein
MKHIFSHDHACRVFTPTDWMEVVDGWLGVFGGFLPGGHHLERFGSDARA